MGHFSTMEKSRIAMEDVSFKSHHSQQSRLPRWWDEVKKCCIED